MKFFAKSIKDARSRWWRGSECTRVHKDACYSRACVGLLNITVKILNSILCSQDLSFKWHHGLDILPCFSFFFCFVCDISSRHSHLRGELWFKVKIRTRPLQQLHSLQCLSATVRELQLVRVSHCENSAR